MSSCDAIISGAKSDDNKELPAAMSQSGPNMKATRDSKKLKKEEGKCTNNPSPNLSEISEDSETSLARSISTPATESLNFNNNQPKISKLLQERRNEFKEDSKSSGKLSTSSDNKKRKDSIYESSESSTSSSDQSVAKAPPVLRQKWKEDGSSIWMDGRADYDQICLIHFS